MSGLEDMMILRHLLEVDTRLVRLWGEAGVGFHRAW